MIEIYIGDEWVEWKSAHLAAHYLFKNGEFINELTGYIASSSIWNGFIATNETHTAITPTISYDNGELVATASVSGSGNAGYFSGTIFFKPSINLNDLGAIKVKITMLTKGTGNSLVSNADARLTLANGINNNYTHYSGGVVTECGVESVVEITTIPDNTCYIAIPFRLWHYSAQTNGIEIRIKSIEVGFY